MLELDEEAQLLVSLYLKAHKLMPVRGSGTVRLEFQSHPATRLPVIEPLLHAPDGKVWYVRWPNGSLRWVTEGHLRSRGFEPPTRALVAELLEDGMQPRWQPTLPDGPQ